MYFPCFSSVQSNEIIADTINEYHKLQTSFIWGGHGNSDSYILIHGQNDFKKTLKLFGAFRYNLHPRHLEQTFEKKILLRSQNALIENLAQEHVVKIALRYVKLEKKNFVKL